MKVTHALDNYRKRTGIHVIILLFEVYMHVLGTPATVKKRRSDKRRDKSQNISIVIFCSTNVFLLEPIYYISRLFDPLV